MPHPIKAPKKLIEVALPLDDINAASEREKSIRHGHPSTLHLWWARRPLATARAVIFSQMVNDPGYERQLGRGVNKKDAAKKREELFGILRELVKWENTNNEELLARAREEIRKSWRETCELNREHPQAKELFNPEKLPAFHDPFAGGGAIPLEAQRLGLESYASDLNPVAVMINKAMIEIPPKFAGKAPVHPVSKKELGIDREWKGAQGLAEDVRYYGNWMRDEALKRIGHLYPDVQAVQNADGSWRHATPAEIKNSKSKSESLTVIAWLWARTVKSPNPAFAHVDVPLVSTFWLSSKAGKESYIEPVVDGDAYSFTVRTGTPTDPAQVKTGTKLARGANFRCILSDTPISPDYIKAEGTAKRMGARLLAIVAEGERGRVYLPPTDEHEKNAKGAKPTWRPETSLPNDPRNFWTLAYGLTTYGDLFTGRQLVALTTFADLVQEARVKVLADANSAGRLDDANGIDVGGTGATAYADAVSVYLSFAVDKVANIGSSITSWMSDRGAFRETFARQAIPMVWDYAEANPFVDAGGSIGAAIDKGVMAINALPTTTAGMVTQQDATTQQISRLKIVSTDPPYYDNIGYADLSDFFYIWLRRSLRPVFPILLAAINVPKAEELVATPYRHGGKQAAETFFMDGMTLALHNLAEQAHPVFPVTIYYAFKQSETSDTGTANTGWETFLDAVLKAGFAITGTWPMRTEGSGRMIAKGTNALASSIVLVCRKREIEAEKVSRREFIRELKAVLPEALEEMISSGGEHAPVAAVDLAQAVIGPGMAVFSKYAAVLEANGEPMSVHAALTLINQYLPGDPDEFDADTRFCLAWFESHGWGTEAFGAADVLARAKGTSVEGVRDAGVLEATGGRVRLLKYAEYPADWNPATDNRTPVWEAVHQLIRALRQQGEAAAGSLLVEMQDKTEGIRQLAYRLYVLCERKGWAEDARAYDELIDSWGAVEHAAADNESRREKQGLLDL